MFAPAGSTIKRSLSCGSVLPFMLYTASAACLESSYTFKGLFFLVTYYESITAMILDINRNDASVSFKSFSEVRLMSASAEAGDVDLSIRQDFVPVASIFGGPAMSIVAARAAALAIASASSRHGV